MSSFLSLVKNGNATDKHRPFIANTKAFLQVAENKWISTRNHVLHEFNIQATQEIYDKIEHPMTK